MHSKCAAGEEPSKGCFFREANNKFAIAFLFLKKRQSLRTLRGTFPTVVPEVSSDPHPPPSPPPGIKRASPHQLGVGVARVRSCPPARPRATLLSRSRALSPGWWKPEPAGRAGLEAQPVSISLPGCRQAGRQAAELPKEGEPVPLPSWPFFPGEVSFFSYLVRGRGCGKPPKESSSSERCNICSSLSLLPELLAAFYICLHSNVRCFLKKV